MFTNVLEKLGIWDIVAPSSRSADTRTRTRTRNDEEQKKRRKSQESRDEALARKLQAEYDRKFRLLKAQKDAEDRAETQGLYAKKQRVSYIHRGTNTQYDAMVVGVHFDDGPDKPYYVSKKNRHLFEDFFHCLFVRSF